MSLLLRYSKLGFEVTLRLDSRELECLAVTLHSSALVDISECSAETSAHLVWQRASGGRWRILLKGQPWEAEWSQAEDLYLQSDSLLDDLVRERLTTVPLLHAGGVVDAKGRALVICGASGAGKTSLVLACILRGWNWLSDELLCFRQKDSRMAEGFRRNFNLKQRSFSCFPQTSDLPGNREIMVNDSRKCIRFLNPDALRCGSFASSGIVAAIVVPAYDAGAPTPASTALSGLGLVQSLAPELRACDPVTLAWLAEIGRTVPAFALRYRTPDGAAEHLENLVNQF
ncbi:hypothetical protein EV701_110181 [Chthoniobacter flavus]|uniref:hypothetical protein n=1 Tax=Chthoniobacter flavus TaxID=191863 RepID=UPI0010E8E95E|nr:hypothetical protein [Chthoniobacter flavus]TCO90557.1 hypothetical protein EV701_110181 [Chthoniobacter flavus]